MRVLHSALYQREEIKVSRGSVVQHSHPASVIRMRMRSCLVLLCVLVSLCGSQDTSRRYNDQGCQQESKYLPSQGRPSCQSLTRDSSGNLPTFNSHLARWVKFIMAIIVFWNSWFPFLWNIIPPLISLFQVYSGEIVGVYDESVFMWTPTEYTTISVFTCW